MTFPERGEKIAAIAGDEENRSSSLLGSIIKLGWGFYGIFVINSSSSDSEVSEDVKKCFFVKLKYWLFGVDR